MPSVSRSGKLPRITLARKQLSVDGVKLLNSRQRLELIDGLELDGKASPLRRVWIPKPGSDELRGLGIPTIHDRAVQMLAKLILEPEWEAVFEPNSYGFRPGRSCQDAIEAIFDSISKSSEKWVLDADFAKCFDNIDHSKLLKKSGLFPRLHRQVKAWLKAGVMDGLNFSETDSGTPQGGVISPLLANIALHGIETYVKDYWKKNLRGAEKNPYYYVEPRLIRYADDFVVLHPDLEVILKLKSALTIWAKQNTGLLLKESKTQVVSTVIGI